MINLRKWIRNLLIGDELEHEERLLKRTAQIIALTEGIHSALESRLIKAAAKIEKAQSSYSDAPTQGEAEAPGIISSVRRRRY